MCHHMRLESNSTFTTRLLTSVPNPQDTWQRMRLVKLSSLVYPACYDYTNTLKIIIFLRA